MGASFASTGFMGDINPTNPFYFKSGGGGIQAKYNFNPTWGVQASLSYLHLNATDLDSKDPYRYARGRHFKNHIGEFGLRGEFNFFKFIAGRETTKHTPYLFAGLAGLIHNPYVTLSNGNQQSLETLKLQADERPLQKMAISIPFGIGFKYNIRGPWSVGAEMGYRWALSDQLDNIYDFYPTTDTAPSGNFPYTSDEWRNMAFPQGNYADYYSRAIGDTRSFDGYMTAGVTLTYTIISKKCYWWN